MKRRPPWGDPVKELVVRTREIRAANAKRRSERFNDTTGAFTWNHRSAQEHPDRCRCQDEATPHKHYPEPPHSCARCSACSAYSPAVPEPEA